jgi:hypothetical protein
MTGLKAHVVHLYPGWVLSRGNGTLICISRQLLDLFAPLFLQWSLLNSKTLKITGFGALAGQIQHMAAQKVGFMPRPIRYGPPNLHVSSSAALETAYQSSAWNVPVMGPIPWEHAKSISFWASVSPLWCVAVRNSFVGGYGSWTPITLKNAFYNLLGLKQAWLFNLFWV